MAVFSNCADALRGTQRTTHSRNCRRASSALPWRRWSSSVRRWWYPTSPGRLPSSLEVRMQCQSPVPGACHTGATSATGSVGIGLQVAKALALNGARVIIAGRSETRCAEYVRRMCRWFPHTMHGWFPHTMHGWYSQDVHPHRCAYRAVGEIQVSIQEAWAMLHNTNHDVPHPGDVDYAMLDMTSLRYLMLLCMTGGVHCTIIATCALTSSTAQQALLRHHAMWQCNDAMQ